MKLTKILGSPIAFHRCLAELTGSVTSGLMLSQAVYWTGKTKDHDGWFWKTQDEWFEETMLSRKEQESARRRLREITFEGEPLWHEQLRGVPAKLFYRVDMDILECLFSTDQYAQKEQTSMPKRDILEGPKGAYKKAQKGHTFLSAETTTEITSETTSESVVRSAGAIVANQHTPQTEDAVSIALTIFPQLGVWQQDLIANGDINHTHLWRKALEDWRDNRYSLRNITGLIDSYYRLEKQDNRDKEYRNAQNGSTTRPIHETHNQRAARKTIALIAELTGQDGGDNSLDSANKGFELPPAFR